MINSKKITGRMLVTVLMIFFFLLVMSFHHIPKLFHEVLGLVWLGVTMLHLWQNRKWFKSFAQGRWTTIRIIDTVIDGLLLLTLLMVIIAGSGISNHLFKDLMPLDIRRSITLHQLHVSLPYAMIILMGLHWGLHFDGWLNQWKRVISFTIPAKISKVAGLALAVIIIAGGIYGSILHQVWNRLMMKHIFATEAAGLPFGSYLILLLSIIGLYVIVGMAIRRIK
ncbi:hypothetical protein [uncultured Anaerovibrio sp.]|uniref:hypothetical protein n=1 Tax=uncultured Anaerovibrio sp. TaxID=361586 RepID=UPI0026255776|nr:hypothetical protein [uncultured Anaerovibrio sp.]